MKKQKPPVKRIAEVIEQCQRIYLKGLLEHNRQKLKELDNHQKKEHKK